MLVYKLEDYNRSRVKVYFDEDRPAFVLYKKEIERYGIKQGGELSDDTYETIITEVLKKRAISRMLYLLDSGGRTESQVRKKLSDGFYPKEAIDAAIDYGLGRHYIDDGYYARNFAENRTKNKSRLKVKQELLQRGIDPEIIDNTFQNLENDEKDTIERLILKKYPDVSQIEKENEQKLIRSLMLKGFRYDDVHEVMLRLLT
ncbi:MAG: RecX family transcriptional regulator [Lachnospiraceae bacterium]|nr:RecX family transcriptional regulator [Lachnospiraceae bacterium]